MDAYATVKNDFLQTMGTAEDRKCHCPLKTCMVIGESDGVAIERFTVMPANDGLGNFGAKTIYVNDDTGEYRETYILNNEVYDYSGMTIQRCAYMSKLVVELAGLTPKRVGFIGNGRVNLATKRLLNPAEVVIHGAPGRESKNKEKFGDCMVDTDFSLLNTCDVVFVCTNSYKRELLISGNQLKANFIVVLDCGYTLGEDFRSGYSLYCDYPEQLYNQYQEEFPFDKSLYEYKPLMDIIHEMKTCVYLHGCGINDLSMAKVMANEKTIIE